MSYVCLEIGDQGDGIGTSKGRSGMLSAERAALPSLSVQEDSRVYAWGKE